MQKAVDHPMNERYDALVVGAGMAGLTAAAYLAKAGYYVQICERSEKPGGLVADFRRSSIHFDAGLRAVENSGVIRPMLNDLGIKMDFLPNPVSIRIGERIVRLAEGGLDAYGDMLKSLFPENAGDVAAIQAEIRRVMEIMDVLYGIDNPLFVDFKKDPKYLLHTLLPWLVRYQRSMRKVERFQMPVEAHLTKLTRNRALIDMIAQHFFRDTPGFFALSYFGLYLDYLYPKGGTGALARKMADFIREHGGEIECKTEIARIDPHQRVACTAEGRNIGYRTLIWAADQKAFYRALGNSPDASRAFQAQTEKVARGRGGDSVLSVFLSLDLVPEVIHQAFGAHCFYTPATQGLSSLGVDSWIRLSDSGKRDLTAWVRRFLAWTTFEISCPVLRDASLAPEGRTGLIVSTLFPIDLVRTIARAGWYSEFEALCLEAVLAQLDQALPGIGAAVTDSSCASPLTIEKRTGNTDGAITGWAFGEAMPAESRLPKIARSVRTPVPHIFQAGQWTFSPSGLPVSILTGRLAADASARALRRKRP